MTFYSVALGFSLVTGCCVGCSGRFPIRLKKELFRITNLPSVALLADIIDPLMLSIVYRVGSKGELALFFFFCLTRTASPSSFLF